ncbi:epoxide hydrolase family protein [Microbispora sp. NPDC049125]|uniref:epoxide hydrolase family protein n=1 Tax=Microbispora sp. NPDC049125 TaxID=3154929 RepID=UPI0034671845
MTADEVRPFRLEVPEDRLQDLRDRLARTRWPEEPAGAGWAYGVPADHLRALAEHWKNAYDWRRHEAELNAYPQFTTVIDGAVVHFLHVRSPEPGALPLVMTHGWPGSVVEFLDVIGPLTDPGAHGGDPADAFHLVLPHIPGFALSGPTADTGWDVPRVARAWAELMRRLAYGRYGAQGGDWGHAITKELAAAYPEQVIGIHLNTLLTRPPTDPEEVAALSEDDRARLDRLAEAEPEMSGYAHLQGTRPHTLAYALTDSPVGQLAWIAEKFHEWSDPDIVIPRDRLLTNVMLYWLTGTAGSSARIYYETFHPPTSPRAERVEVPTGVAVFARDVARPVRRLAERDHAIARWTEVPLGGHFGALECPGPFSEDLRAFFRGLRRV